MRLKRLASLVLCLLLAASSVSALASESVYPIPGDINLTYFGQLHSKVAKSYPGWEALQVVQDWFKITGVTLKFQCPPSGMEDEQFSLMLASGDYADIINYDMVNKVEGGLTKLFEDNVIVDLTDYLPEYAPNYWKYLSDNPDLKREVMNDEGRIFCFVFAKGGGYLLSTQGPIVREDIIAELGLQSPKTIDEWDTVLRAVKAAKPDMIPYTGTMDNLLRTFTPAWEVSSTYSVAVGGKWYQNGEGKALYAPIQPGFKEFLTKMHGWYADGLLDQDIISLDDATKDNKMSASLAFSTFGAGSNQVAAYMNANKDNATFSAVGVRVPTLNPEDRAKYVTEYSATANPQLAISTSCKNLIEAIRMYDWGYSAEGNRRLNWGVEGVSYVLDANGKPQYTDLILKNPDGKSVDAILAQYALTAVKGPAMLVQDPDYMLQYYALDQQKRSVQNWSDKDLNSHQFPNVSYSDEEVQTVTNAMADINTYVDSMIGKFIIGTEPLDNFDAFVSTVNTMGIQTAADAQQAALDRYNAR